MNKREIFYALSFCLLFLTGQAFAEDEKKNVQLEKIGNSMCPVSGEKTGTMGKALEVDHGGKIVNLCCMMCKKDFLKDPEKYIAIAEKEVEAGQDNAMMDEEHSDDDHHEHDHDHHHE